MRTAEFDRTYVLRQAMQTFMQFGYSKTSMQKLTESTGLHPGSIYCAFKNKQGLLLAAIEQYQADKLMEMKAHFDLYDSIKEGLFTFILGLIGDCNNNESSKVCLLTKTLTELEGQNPEVSQILSSNLCQFEHSIRLLLEQAQTNGELPNQANSAAKAQFLVVGIHGLRTYAFTNSDPACLVKLTKQLIDYTFL